MLNKKGSVVIIRVIYNVSPVDALAISKDNGERLKLLKAHPTSIIIKNIAIEHVKGL
ncbi:hypothetical protein JBO41_09845 [Enterobacter asburiae]|uniref:hypothetical protein n=1 Tax=Enterobacter asburiae TaxID=61645 RepID=UPI00192B2CB8|nr:hypothetical protein [Enterobacter asburiae]MBL5912424.1 hypothetical protein [Enterobacter asburiae]MBL5916933.1 hypothetical protein [Enterobacter asburiae]MBL5972163.1 hypothetical protein [Enterobacter asburiae]